MQSWVARHSLAAVLLPLVRSFLRRILLYKSHKKRWGLLMLILIFVGFSGIWALSYRPAVSYLEFGSMLNFGRRGAWDREVSNGAIEITMPWGIIDFTWVMLASGRVWEPPLWTSLKLKKLRDWSPLPVFVWLGNFKYWGSLQRGLWVSQTLPESLR